MPHLPKTLSVLEKTVDMRIPLTFNLDDTALIGDILEDEITTYMDKKKAEYESYHLYRRLTANASTAGASYVL